MVERGGCVMWKQTMALQDSNLVHCRVEGSWLKFEPDFHRVHTRNSLDYDPGLLYSLRLQITARAGREDDSCMWQGQQKAVTPRGVRHEINNFLLWTLEQCDQYLMLHNVTNTHQCHFHRSLTASLEVYVYVFSSFTFFGCDCFVLYMKMVGAGLQACRREELPFGDSSDICRP